MAGYHLHIQTTPRPGAWKSGGKYWLAVVQSLHCSTDAIGHHSRFKFICHRPFLVMSDKVPNCASCVCALQCMVFLLTAIVLGFFSDIRGL